MIQYFLYLQIYLHWGLAMKYAETILKAISSFSLNSQKKKELSIY